MRWCPKLTNIRYDDHLQGAIPDAGLGVHQTQQSLRGENNLATWSCLKTAIYSALKCKLASLKNPKNSLAIFKYLHILKRYLY